MKKENQIQAKSLLHNLDIYKAQLKDIDNIQIYWYPDTKINYWSYNDAGKIEKHLKLLRKRVKIEILKTIKETEATLAKL